MSALPDWICTTIKYQNNAQFFLFSFFHFLLWFDTMETTEMAIEITNFLDMKLRELRTGYEQCQFNFSAKNKNN